MSKNATSWTPGQSSIPVSGRWKPGQSGNPKGRPKRNPPTQELLQIFAKLEKRLEKEKG